MNSLPRTLSDPEEQGTNEDISVSATNITEREVSDISDSNDSSSTLSAQEECKTPNYPLREQSDAIECCDLGISAQEHYRPSHHTVRKRMFAHLNHVKETWRLAVRTYRVDREFFHALLALHCGFPELLTRDLFRRHLSSLSTLFRLHALQQPEFRKLSPSEQSCLLERNAPLFTHFVLGAYLVVKTGREQLECLLLGKAAKRLKKTSAKLLNITPSMLNSVLGLFATEDDLAAYETSRPIYNQLDSDQISIISLLCLYHNSSQFHSDDLLTLADWAQEVLNIGVDSKSLRSLIVELEGCRNIFDKFAGIQNEENGDVQLYNSGELNLLYSDDEQSQLLMILSDYDQVMSSVQLDKGVILGMIQAMKGIVPPSSFGFSAALHTRERFKRLLLGQKGFHSLPSHDRVSLLQQAVPFAMALHMTKFHSMQIPNEQMLFMLKGKTMPKALVKKSWSCLKPIHISRANFQNIFTQQQSKRLVQLTAHLSSLVKDLVTYKLLVLTVLTFNFTGRAARLHRQYASMYHRHVESLGTAKDDFMLDFANGISQVREFAILIRRPNNPSRS